MDSFSLFTFSPEGDVYSSRKVTLFPVSCTPKGEKITFCSFALDCSCQTGVSAAKHIDLVINPLRLSPEDTSGLHTAETSEVTVAQLEVKLLFQVLYFAHTSYSGWRSWKLPGGKVLYILLFLIMTCFCCVWVRGGTTVAAAASITGYFLHLHTITSKTYKSLWCILHI